MNWKLVYLPEAEKDFRRLSGNERIVVAKALEKVLKNPLPVNEGGYGKPLGNKQGNNLSGFLKIKLKNLGIRVVYKLIKIDGQMLVVVIGARADDEVYDVALRRAENTILKNNGTEKNSPYRYFSFQTIAQIISESQIICFERP